MLVNQPGNITVKDYTYESNIDVFIKDKDTKIREEFNNKQKSRRTGTKK